MYHMHQGSTEDSKSSVRYHRSYAHVIETEASRFDALTGLPNRGVLRDGKFAHDVIDLSSTYSIPQC